MNVLLTGAAGFLGSHLCDQLLADGHRVIGIDNFVTGRPQNIAHLAGHDRFVMLQADASRPIELPPGLPPIDAIAHLASPASPADFAPLAIEIMRVNSEGTYHLLELARKLSCRFLLASTSEVYGDPEVHPQSEDYVGHVSITGPRAVYDESKRFAEAMVWAFRRRHGTDGRVVRIFNTYGPRMRPDDGRVLPAFIMAALRGQPLPVQGQGLQTRSFCYVSDTADGICRMLFGPHPGPINIGNPQEITIRQLAEEIIAATASRSIIQFLPAPPDDPKRRCPDIRRAKELLNWSPQVSRPEGLARTIAYFRALLVPPGGCIPRK